MTEWELYTAECSRNWLEHMRDLKHDIAKLQDEVDVARSLALPQGVDYSRSKVTTSPTADQIPNAVIRLHGLVADYIVELDAYIDELMDARQRVNMLEDSRHRAVLTLYYLNGHSWQTVAEKMHYAEGWCFEIRNEALPLMYEYLPRQWKPIIPRAL